MSGWPAVSLGEVLTKSEEWVQLHPDQRYKEVTVRLWGNGAVLRREVLAAEIASSSRLRVHANQFIISRIDARNGASGLIPPDLEGAIVSNDFPVFTLDEEKIEPKFLGWLSKTRNFIDLCRAASEGTTNRVRLKEDRFLQTAIPLPPLAEQRRLVERIDALAARIEEARRIRNETIDETSALTKSALRSIFTDLPEGGVTLHEVCPAIIDCLHSNPVYAEEGVPTVRSPDVGWGKLFVNAARKTDEAEYRRRTSRGEPAPGDIVVVREGGGTGKAGIVEKGQRFSLGQRVMMLRPDPSKIEPMYLLYHWLSPLIYEDQIMSRMMGSASPHLNIGAAKKFPIRLPPLSRQRQIVTYLDRIQAKSDELRHNQVAAAEELDAMLPAILDRAFRGDLC
jgi:type I restriction enzyme S subunit